jgi:hypothetical protein
MSSPTTLKVFCEYFVFLKDKTQKIEKVGIGVYIPDHENKFNLSRGEKNEDNKINLIDIHIKSVVFGLEQAFSASENYPNKYKEILISSNLTYGEIKHLLYSSVSRDSKSEIKKTLLSLVEKLKSVEIIWMDRKRLFDNEAAAFYINEAHIISYNASIEAL